MFWQETDDSLTVWWLNHFSVLLLLAFRFFSPHAVPQFHSRPVLHMLLFFPVFFSFLVFLGLITSPRALQNTWYELQDHFMWADPSFDLFGSLFCLRVFSSCCSENWNWMAADGWSEIDAVHETTSVILLWWPIKSRFLRYNCNRPLGSRRSRRCCRACLFIFLIFLVLLLVLSLMMYLNRRSLICCTLLPGPLPQNGYFPSSLWWTVTCVSLVPKQTSAAPL